MTTYLLTFAHRGEAQAFLKHWNFKSVAMPFEGLYQYENLFLLITGEGLQNASVKSAAVVSKYDHIDKIINLGICGSLDENYKINSIFEIRTIYSNQNDHFEFKSYTCSAFTDLPRLDLLSVDKRILTPEDRNHLHIVAPLVDREAHGIALAAQSLKKPLHSIKLVSDFAGSGQEICHAVKENAPEWSDSLLNVFLRYEQNTSSKINETDSDLPSELNDFHITVSQKRELKNVLKALAIKDISLPQLLKNIQIEEVRNSKLREKEKTTILIEKLVEQLNPIHSKVKQLLDRELAKLNSGHIKTSYDPSFESDELKIHASINHQKNIDDLISALQKVDYQRIKEILRGEIDV